MPVDYKKYPKNWPEISDRIRFGRARSRCECMGECGKHHGERCKEIQQTIAKTFNGVVILTVAHLDHNPQNNDLENLRAMCQACHNRYDVEFRRKNRAARRRRELIEAGQKELL